LAQRCRVQSLRSQGCVRAVDQDEYLTARLADWESAVAAPFSPVFEPAMVRIGATLPVAPAANSLDRILF
jgi:hypothetical protein